MEATGLERDDPTFAAIVDHVQDLRDSQENIKDTLKMSQDPVDDLKKKWDAHQALDKMENKVSEFKVKLAWALFTTVDKEATLSSEVSITSCAVFPCNFGAHSRLRCYVELNFIEDLTENQMW
jgi:hypothetical protein